MLKIEDDVIFNYQKRSLQITLQESMNDIALVELAFFGADTNEERSLLL